MRKSAEYEQIISKYRNQQVKLHNKLYNINLFLNMCMNNGKNNIPNQNQNMKIKIIYI